jgi:hypothetical protein
VWAEREQDVTAIKLRLPDADHESMSTWTAHPKPDDETRRLVLHDDGGANVAEPQTTGGSLMTQRLRRGTIMTELRAQGCAGSEGAGLTRSPEAHREHVVRRLLAAGLSAQTLLALLPDFRPIVQRVRHHD